MVEEEGVAEVEEEEEEDDHACGSQSIQCRFVKWKECCIIVAIKIVLTEDMTPLQVALNLKGDCINQQMLILSFKIMMTIKTSQLFVKFLISHYFESHCNEKVALYKGQNGKTTQLQLNRRIMIRWL